VLVVPRQLVRPSLPKALYRGQQGSGSCTESFCRACLSFTDPAEGGSTADARLVCGRLQLARAFRVRLWAMWRQVAKFGRCVVGSDAASVVAEDHVHSPSARSSRWPVGADHRADGGGRQPQRGDLVVSLAPAFRPQLRPGH
jgi:hypothetical protein